MKTLQYVTKESYKYYRDIIEIFHKDGMVNAFGFNNSVSEQAYWAFKRWCKEISKSGIPDYAINKNKCIHIYNLTKEECDLSLHQIEKYGYKTEMLILKIMSKYNCGIHDLVPKKGIGNPPMISDLYIKNNYYYLDIRKKGGNKRQLKLDKQTTDELLRYIQSTKKRRNKSPYIFVTKEYYKGAPVQPLRYSAFWARFERNIKPLLYDTGCIPSDKTIKPFSFKGANGRNNGMINNNHYERVV